MVNFCCEFQKGRVGIKISKIPTTVYPGSSDPFYIVTYYIKWFTTSWTYSKGNFFHLFNDFVPNSKRSVPEKLRLALNISY